MASTKGNAGGDPLSYMGVKLTSRDSSIIITEKARTVDLAVGFLFSDIGDSITNLTEHGVVVGGGGEGLSAIDVGATGEALIGNTGADPSWSSTLTVASLKANTIDTNISGEAIQLSGTDIEAVGTESDISIDIRPKGNGSVEVYGEFTVTEPIGILSGGTGINTVAPHAVIVGGITALNDIVVGTNGQCLLGSTGADPVFATLTSSGGTIDFTPGAGTLNLEVTGSSQPIAWTVITSASENMVVNHGYIANFGSVVDFTLPATAAVGDSLKVTSLSSSGWRISQNAGQYISFTGTTTTTGASGYMTGGSGRAVELVCAVADTAFIVLNQADDKTPYTLY